MTRKVSIEKQLDKMTEKKADKVVSVKEEKTKYDVIANQKGFVDELDMRFYHSGRSFRD